MINPYKLRIPYNYCLVKPDKEFDTYQFGGKETGIYSALVAKDEKGNEVSLKQQHLPISGKVYAVCDEIRFNAHKLWHIQDRTSLRRDAYVRAREYQSEIDELRAKSVRFEVPIEVKVHDTVYFEYMAHMVADNEALWFDTTEGQMMLIKYDNLILAKRGEDIKMLNGYVLIENERVEDKAVDGSAIVGTTTESGLILLTGNKTEKKTRTNAIADIAEAGEKIRCYLDFRGYRDGKAKKGDKIFYDPRYARELEYGLHQVFSGRKLRIIQRKDIYGIFDTTCSTTLVNV